MTPALWRARTAAATCRAFWVGRPRAAAPPPPAATVGRGCPSRRGPRKRAAAALSQRRRRQGPPQRVGRGHHRRRYGATAPARLTPSCAAARAVAAPTAALGRHCWRRGQAAAMEICRRRIGGDPRHRHRLLVGGHAARWGCRRIRRGGRHRRRPYRRQPRGRRPPVRASVFDKGARGGRLALRWCRRSRCCHGRRRRQGRRRQPRRPARGSGRAAAGSPITVTRGAQFGARHQQMFSAGAFSLRDRQCRLTDIAGRVSVIDWH